MPNIPVSSIPSNVTSLDQRRLQNQIAGSNFNALLSGNDSNYSLVDEFLSNISGSLNNISGTSAAQTSNTFGFTSGFQSTFGLGGPLPAFINAITAQLHLTAAQNRAFQEIAVNNKDATRSPDSVNKIAAELKKAGIAYS